MVAVFCAACGDDSGNVTNANTTVNINTNNTNPPNGNGTTETNTNTVNTNGTTTANGNKGNGNKRIPLTFNANDANANALNVNSSRPAPTPVKSDQITVNYPNLFLQDDSEDAGKVRFELFEVTGPALTSTTTNGNTTETKSPFANMPSEAERVKYDVLVEVKLLANGLTITELSDPKRLYTGQREKWEWRLKPAPAMREGQPVFFWFQVNVTWKAKTQDVSTKEMLNVWQKRFEADVGPPARQVNAALYGSPLFAAGGFITIGTSRRRRKGLPDAGPDKDGIEDQPDATTTKAMPGMQSKMAAPEEEVEDEVNGTVYAPGQAGLGDSFLVQVFIHLPEQAAALDEIAKEADEDAKRRISSKLQKKIKRGTELTFYLQMPGLRVDDDVQSCVWMGEPAWVQFGVTVPEDCKPKNIIGTVTVSEMSVPVGHLKFMFKIKAAVSSEDEAEAPSLEPVPAGNLTRYQQAFISYSSKDRQEVLKRVQMLNVAKIKFFQDLLTLEPGDQWEKMLYEYIDKSDVFFLFWSKAASESEWVKKEVEYAIKLRDDKELPDPEIIPVIIEGPPAAKPPAELSSIHFNDKLIYFINSRENET
jgi:hypothetical protein